MGVSVVGGSTSSGGGLTPFDPSFSYNFPSGAQGQTVSLDMQSSIPAGTYTIEGTAEFKRAPQRVQLLNSSNTIVGSATLTRTNGSYGTTNSATYNASITASAGFSKIKFLGTTGGSSIAFSSSAPTSPLAHVKLSPGVRNIDSVSLADLFLTDPNAISYTNVPTSFPANSGYWFASFFYNGKTYILTSTLQPGVGVSSGSGTNTIRLYAWNHATGTWSGSLGSVTSNQLGGINAYAAPGTVGNSYLSTYAFKNGKIMLKWNYWFNESTVSRGQQRFFTLDTSNDYFSVSSAYDNFATGNLGSAAYNPTEDSWYVLSKAVYIGSGGYYETTNRIWKLGNDFSLNYMNFVNNISGNDNSHLIMCENKNNPKIVAIGNENNDTNTYRAVYYSGWTNNGTYSGSAWDMGNAGNGNTFPFFVNHSNQVTIQTTLFGVANSILAINTTNTPLYAFGGAYTFPSAQITSDAELGWQTFNTFGPKSPVFNGTARQAWRIQPINSTQVAVVIQDIDFSGNAFGTFGVRAIPLPSSASV